MKRFQYSLLGKEVKKQTSVAEKQYQGIDKIFNRDEKEEPVTIKKEEPLKTEESSLVYDSKCIFSDYRNVGKYLQSFFMTKYDRLRPFYHRLNDFRNIVTRTEETKIKKKIVYNNAKKLYNTLLTIHFN